MKVALPSGCGLYGKNDGFRLCSGCKVMLYCSVEHQTAHRAAHKSDSNDPQYDWGDVTLPYLDIKDANPLEPIDLFLCGRPDLSHIVALVLVKVKLYFVLLATHRANGSYETATEKNRKIMDGMMKLKDSTIARNPHVANLTCLEAEPGIEKVKAQIRKLYDIVNKANPYLWPELINPDENLNAAPSMYSPGSKEKMQATIMSTWQAWNETFGALEIIYAIVHGDAF
ncbi:hypothetical protein N7471_001036 [Penicillium samsonianum]|uniref:uncharacterized protein n=1 Tax=Penicillium samsonianum TaxID=1882272 RepID=UPI002548306C|nr:uncharacterized protein N7471_001036 [Penicillium samsonianum]KAJ6149837.1 hypothetical protein N7471_001036 [Penicillium samsonianum]